ncbi:hypothetical protein BVC80_1289g139 [Macleaya cordata]|uniref:Uncharacterized protein n=1 Tax=Macleaya cordata TaxID=56857 RepID=A0A200Q9U3_MACCD|nr:hypothetical protein BVC80_1289g139 [Macleaya cordata]
MRVGVSFSFICGSEFARGTTSMRSRLKTSESTDTTIGLNGIVSNLLYVDQPPMEVILVIILISVIFVKLLVPYINVT